jgi:hypothetical protein
MQFWVSKGVVKEIQIESTEQIESERDVEYQIIENQSERDRHRTAQDEVQIFFN